MYIYNVNEQKNVKSIELPAELENIVCVKYCSRNKSLMIKGQKTTF